MIKGSAQKLESITIAYNQASPSTVFLRRRRVQAVVNSTFSLSSSFAPNLFALFCITWNGAAIFTMTTQSPVQGYVDPNFPNPNGPDDASIIIYRFVVFPYQFFDDSYC